MLRRIGGFAAFSECMADDYMIGQAVRSVGFDVTVAEFTVGHVCFEQDFRTLIERQIRSARTIRSIDPIGYVGSILTHPLPLALIAALLGAQGALLLAGVALACRVAMCLCVERAFALDRQPYWLIPLQDVMLFAVYAASFLGATVTWRGHKYRLASDGSLAQIEK
jgi:ceramide glucosyltransferase